MVAPAQTPLTDDVKTATRKIDTDGRVAAAMRPVIEGSFGVRIPIRFEFWDGSVLNRPERHVATFASHRPTPSAACCGCPNELGLAAPTSPATSTLDGDIFDAVVAFRDAKPEAPTPGRAWRCCHRRSARPRRSASSAARSLRRPRRRACAAGGTRCDATPQRDQPPLRRRQRLLPAGARSGDDVLVRPVRRPTMPTLDDAQAAKHDLICRKLGLARTRRRGGCSTSGAAGGRWPSTPPSHHDVTRRRHHHQRGAGRAGPRAGRRGRRRRSGRDPPAGLPRRSPASTFDAISSIGMSEHVGHEQARPVLRHAPRACSSPQGRLLNHAISSVGGSKLGRTSFVGRYVFPDGELIDVGDVVLAMERAGFEVRDVESLREHYARTLRAWVANLEANWDEAVAAGRRGPGPDLAALHGRVGHRVRGRRHRHPPGARRRAHRYRRLRHARDAARLGLTNQNISWLTRVDHQAGETADDRAVDADELQVATDLQLDSLAPWPCRPTWRRCAAMRSATSPR